MFFGAQSHHLHPPAKQGIERRLSAARFTKFDASLDLRIQLVETANHVVLPWDSHMGTEESSLSNLQDVICPTSQCESQIWDWIQAISS